jgi:hypothetical protein
MVLKGMEREQYSLGIGDRFGREGAAQLRALQAARDLGVPVTPVWNKSNREHTIIGTSPEDTRREADAAVRASGWDGVYYVDADHIGSATVERFVGASDFFTIDVAEFIGRAPEQEAAARFLKGMGRLKGLHRVPGVADPIEVTEDMLQRVAQTYVAAIEEAARVYRYLVDAKGPGTFVTEISMDEAASAQPPEELLLVLGGIALAEIPVLTIAPRFSGAFLKGVDYVGDRDAFAREFENDIALLAFAHEVFGLPRDLRLSIHSGSDKFSLYPLMHRISRKLDTGFHLKTAGTTWLEEVAGLAAAGGEGLAVAQEIYAESYRRYEEMTAPYRSVVAIDRTKLPDPRTVARWNSQEFVGALRHDRSSGRFNRDLRQLVHVGFKVAAEMGERFTSLLQECRGVIEPYVTENILKNHIEPLFVGRTPVEAPGQAAGRGAGGRKPAANTAR